MRSKQRVHKPAVKPHPEMKKLINRLMATRQIHNGVPVYPPITNRDEPDGDEAWSRLVHIAGWAMVGVMALTIAYVYFLS